MSRLSAPTFRPEPSPALAHVSAFALLLLLLGCSGGDEPATTAQDALADVQDIGGDTGAVEDSGAAPKPLVDGIVSLSPEHGPSSGGTEVTLKGKGFTDAASVWFGESKAVAFQLIDDETLVATTPPRPPGIVDVTVLRVDEEARTTDELRIAAAFRYFAAVRVDSVSPAKGPSRGGAVTTITGAGFRKGTHFVFGTRLAVDPVIFDEFTATVVTPPGVAGPVDVVASNDDGAGQLDDGYTYLDVPEPEVSGVTVLPVKPDILDAAGGTPIEVRWNGSAGGPLKGVRVGGLMATQLEAKGGNAATVVAPKGSPGPADVSLIFDLGGKSGVATRKDGVLYTTTKPFVAALVPARGSQAGGTVVQVVGGALNRLTTLRFADKKAKDGVVKHPGLAWYTAPAGEPGTVDVTAHFSGSDKQSLFNAWTWFDPQQAGWGTWGGPIDGDLNVTVRREDWPGGVVQGALVVIGESLTPELKGYTDARGQVTLSVPGLEGPLNVHASAPGFGAGSVVAFDARNVTILIRKHPGGEPGGGGGTTDPGPIFDLGTVKGTVRYVDKVVQLPLGSCAGVQAKAGEACGPCDGGCGQGLGCSGLLDALGGLSLAKSATSTTDTFCLAPCQAVDDCDAGWECRAVGTPGQATWTTRCVPRVGEPQTRCETSAYSRFQDPPHPGDGATAAKDGSFTLKTRLGEMAVMCRSGYVDAQSQAFIPLIMGVTRGVIVPDDKNVVTTEVWLDTPLTRTVHFALEPLPVGPETSAHRRFLRAWLDLGGEGFLELGQAETWERTDHIDVDRMPSQLQGSLATLPWTVYAGLVFDDDDEGAPYSLAMNRDVSIAAGDHVAWWPTGASAPSQGSAWATPVRALAAGAAGLFGVGEGGRVLRWGAGDFTPQQSPTTRDLRALWLDPATPDGWAGGEDGVLLRRDALLGWQAAPSPTAAGIVGLSAGTLGPWLLDEKGALFHFDGQAWQPASGPTAWTGARALAVHTVSAAPPAAAVTHDALWLVGDGAVWQGVAGASGKLSWTSVKNVPANARWRAVLVEGDRVWVAGEAGRLGLVKSGAMTVIDSGVSQPIRALAPRAGGGAHAVGGAGTWLELAPDGKVVDRSVKGLEVDLHGIAALQGTWIASGLPTIRVHPYLPMPTITEPAEDKSVGDSVAWTTPPGPAAEMHRVQIATFWRQSYWTIHAPGDLSAVPLANYVQLGGWNPLPGGPLRVRVWRLHGPKLSVDKFNHNEMTPWAWGAWSYAWRLSKK